MADPVITKVETAVAAQVVTVKAKLTAFVAAHYSKVVSVAAGYTVAKFGVIGFIWKVL